MQAVDTNVLVNAFVASGVHHVRARSLVGSLAEGGTPWAIPWPCIYELLRVVTHPRVFRPPMPMARARADVSALLASPSLVLLGATDRHAEVLEAVLRESGASGNLVHDAHIATLCREHGVTEILTGDRDFTRFSFLRVTDPFAP